MRAFFAIVLSAAAAFVAPARAADVSVVAPAYYYPVYGLPAEPLVIIDIDPGVSMRAYWEEPWARRRYFPATGHMPKYGRHELNLVRRYNPPAESYYRDWSTSSAVAPRAPMYDVPPTRRLAPAPAPAPKP